MKQRIAAAALAILAAAPLCLNAEPTPAAVATFNSYCADVEARLQRQHSSPAIFLAPSNSPIERINPSGPIPAGSLIHHWRGTAFAPGAHAAAFDRLMQDYASWPRYYSPQILDARLLSHTGDHFQPWMRIRQKHVITVVMDTTYDVVFGHLDPTHGYSTSRSTHIQEVPHEDHGFLWRLNTYWTYEERDGGLALQVESISLTRSIPKGLSWIIGPFIESIPRESLEFTLSATRNALKN